MKLYAQERKKSKHFLSRHSPLFAEKRSKWPEIVIVNKPFEKQRTLVPAKVSK
jgi:hypothetical protein